MASSVHGVPKRSQVQAAISFQEAFFESLQEVCWCSRMLLASSQRAFGPFLGNIWKIVFLNQKFNFFRCAQNCIKKCSRRYNLDHFRGTSGECSFSASNSISFRGAQNCIKMCPRRYDLDHFGGTSGKSCFQTKKFDFVRGAQNYNEKCSRRYSLDHFWGTSGKCPK